MSSIIYIQNLDKRIKEPVRVGYCDSFACRLRGLMFRSQLPMDEGLLLVNERDSRIDSSIHMLFVSFDLAVFWINSGMEVVDKRIARILATCLLPHPGCALCSRDPSRAY